MAASGDFLMAAVTRRDYVLERGARIAQPRRPTTLIFAEVVRPWKAPKFGEPMPDPNTVVAMAYLPPIAPAAARTARTMFW